jgi:acetamidase/formamidase
MQTSFLIAAFLLPVMLGAEDHQVVAKEYYRTFSRAHPVLLRVKPGDVIATKTLDCSGHDFQGESRAPDGNPLTGPFWVEGAEPGDALLVHLLKLRMNRSWGFTYYRLGLFSLTPESIETLYPANQRPDSVLKGEADLVRWELDSEHNVVRLLDPVSKHIKMEFEAKPMLGCIGVAPADDFAPTTAPAGSYGGNLDYNEVRAGATVLLPVYEPGALLFIGDGHALQADGEPTGQGIETSMDVEFSVELHKKANLTGPRLETSDYLISVGAQPEFESDLNRGLQLATTDMVRWLTEEYHLEPWAAHLLVGYQGKYDVITVAGSVGLRIPKRCLANRP